jgi:hypothetical protein
VLQGDARDGNVKGLARVIGAASAGTKSTSVGICYSYIKQIPQIRVYVFVFPKFPHFDVSCWQLTLFIKN